MTKRAKVVRAKLPKLVQEKLDKTAYTRGATVREIYQNRVRRNNTVLIQWSQWDLCKVPGDGSGSYENGFIVLLEPEWYFTAEDSAEVLAAEGLELGVNALLYYSRRHEWNNFRPEKGILPDGKEFIPAMSRTNPLGGTYFARIHATTTSEKIEQGYNTSLIRGAGIRVYEYASTKSSDDAKTQLEALFWSCRDSLEVASKENGVESSVKRKDTNTALALAEGLWDVERLQDARMINAEGYAICPLCLVELSAEEFMKRNAQAEGRETFDNTTTEVSLFHIQELRVGTLQHKPYNLGWGHHHCNVVVKDAGIIPTLKWMKSVIDNNGDSWQLIMEEESLVEEAVGH